jgi:hypothetical protein
VTVIDDRGRLGGRFNVVDAVAATVLLVLIPVAYGAFLLFRTPTPTLVSVVPSTLLEGSRQRLEVNGTNLRPFMRVWLDLTPANSFLIGSTKYALVDLPDLKPGTYDVVLYDYMQEVARLPKAFTIAPLTADVHLEVTGSFKLASEALSASLKAGDRFPATGRTIAEVVAVGQPARGELRLRVGDDMVRVQSAERDLPATLRVTCDSVRAADGTARCMVPGVDAAVAVAPDVLLTFTTPQGPVAFQVAAARAPQASGTDGRGPR